MTIRIPYNQTNSNSAKMLAQAVNKVKEALDALNRVGDVSDAAIYGNDDAAVATEFACPPDKAHDLWTLVSTARAKLNDPAVGEMVKRLDQG